MGVRHLLKGNHDTTSFHSRHSNRLLNNQNPHPIKDETYT